MGGEDGGCQEEMVMCRESGWFLGLVLADGSVEEVFWW